jgi:hypothetical protein
VVTEKLLKYPSTLTPRFFILNSIVDVFCEKQKENAVIKSNEKQ